MRAFVTALFCFGLLAVCAHAETRVALIIGNAQYAHVAPLTNPANDAPLVAMALKRAGFATVEVEHDLDYAHLRAALQKFSRTATGADIALIYYAGHGIEMAGTNYLVPTDATLAHDSDVNFEAIPLALAQDAISGAKKLKVVILDACRNNPFAAKMQGATRAIGRGLARIEPDTSNSLVVYAAKDGTTADDGTGQNSPFAAALATRLVQPGLEVQFIFRAVRDDVLRATKNQQEPMTYGSLGGEPVYFVPTGATRPQNFPAQDAAAEDASDWNAVKDSNDVAQYRIYRQMHPNGKYVRLAEAKIAAMSHPVAQTPTPAPSWNATPGVPAAPNHAQLEQITQIIRLSESSIHNLANMGRDSAARAEARIRQTGNLVRLSQGSCAYLGSAMSGSDLAEGYGISMCTDKTRFSGMWQAGNLFAGIHARTDGCTEAGRFSDGALQMGEIACARGPYRKAVGQFRGGKLQGQAVRYEQDGSVWIGSWTDGLLSGQALKQDAQGKTIEGGEYKAGKQTVAASGP